VNILGRKGVHPGFSVRQADKGLTVDSVTASL
jgi:hypothetical protein